MMCLCRVVGKGSLGLKHKFSHTSSVALTRGSGWYTVDCSVTTWAGRCRTGAVETWRKVVSQWVHSHYRCHHAESQSCDIKAHPTQGENEWAQQVMRTSRWSYSWQQQIHVSVNCMYYKLCCRCSGGEPQSNCKETIDAQRWKESKAKQTLLKHMWTFAHLC